MGNSPQDGLARGKDRPGATPIFGAGALSGTMPAEQPKLPIAAWSVAVLVVLLVVGGLLLSGRGKPVAAPNTLQPTDAYAASLPLTQLAMSQSESLSGGKSTYLDGHIQNTGQKTVVGVTVQVVFQNDEALPPRIETVPVALIRTHEPYIDTELVSAEPLKPGDDREFRLTFETMPSNWNQQMPEVRIVQTSLR
jgi:Protein of unknown function (DUF2393)